MNKRLALLLGFITGVILVIVGDFIYQRLYYEWNEPTHSLTPEQAEAICIEEGIPLDK